MKLGNPKACWKRDALYFMVKCEWWELKLRRSSCDNTFKVSTSSSLDENFLDGPLSWLLDYRTRHDFAHPCRLVKSPVIIFGIQEVKTYQRKLTRYPHSLNSNSGLTGLGGCTALQGAEFARGYARHRQNSRNMNSPPKMTVGIGAIA